MTTATTHSGDGSKSVASFTGSLAEIPLASVLRRIAVEERSGELHVAAPGFNKTVYFDRGFVVFASSDVINDRLGESMIEAGRISRHEFALASMLMKSTKQKFGAVLVEAGIVPEEELGRYVAAQVNRIVLSLFLAKTGDYRFDEGPCTVPVELMVSLSVYRILMDGVRRMSRKALVLRGLPSLDTEVRIVDQPPFTLDLSKLRADEKSVLRAARNNATIQDIVEIVDGHEGVTLRACYGLFSGGILEPVESGSKQRLLRVQEETGTFVLSEIRHKVDVPEESPVDVEMTDAPEPEPEFEPAPEFESEPEREFDPPPPPEPLPVAEAVARPQQPVRSASTPPAEEPGFTLSDLFDWVARAWNWVVGWFSGSPPTAAEEPPRELRKGEQPPRAAVEPTAPAPRAAAPSSAEAVGVPSWSVQDGPDAPTAQPDDHHVGVPSWSLKSDAVDEPADADDTTLGVPSWSNRDAPEEVAARPSLPEPSPEPPAPEPNSERFEPPAWSTMDSPSELEATLEPTHAPDVEAEVEYASIEDIDDEFFIEGAIRDDDDSSMLSQIPHEEVTLDDEGVVLTDEFEIDFELQDEAEVQSEQPASPVTPVPTTPARSEIAPTKPTTETARPKPAAPKSKPLEPSRTKDYEIPESDEPKVSAQGEEMLRMKQSGGESRLLRDVKLHFRMRDWQGAVPLLEQLVLISPGKALYRGMLARAISRDPVRRKEAEEHFVEALRLSPQDPELHYWLGLYYKSFGLSSRAITEFRTTLRINPKHEGARKQLGGGKKDDALGNVLKKLFG